MTRGDPVAIVGIAAQLPSGTWANTNLDYDGFLDFLYEKHEAYEPIPSTRFSTEKIKGRAVGQVITNTGAFLKDVDLFDHMEFGVTAKDARAMPLGVRKLLETAFLSLCDSGIEYRGKNIGCYMAAITDDIISVSGHNDSEATGSFANSPSVAANRISYHLDLRGPSVAIDTACSSSLYATHLAVHALVNGECDAAVVGGSQLNHRFAEWLSYTQGGILSPDGKCKPFDISANGFGRGEGVVVITLKPLDAAMRDHDHVYATILGTGVNASGSLVPANAPAAEAQCEAMHRAFRMAGRSPQEVDFMELHATGTAKGDPIEANWVGSELRRNDELIIGSVKGNVGHLEITSFLASLCKVCGALERGFIPPNVNFNHPNPAIRWKQYRLRVPVEAEPLHARSRSGLPLIGMSSSGITGANGHAVVEGAPLPFSPPQFWSSDVIVEIPALIVAGGLSPRSAGALCDSLLEITEIYESEDLAALARVLGRRARSMPWRSFVQTGGVATLSFRKPVMVPKKPPPVVFVFSGQGTQHFESECLGRELFKSCIPFRDSIMELDAIYESVVGTSLVETTGLFNDTMKNHEDTLGDIWPIAVTLPALTMLQLALVDALSAVGVTPDIVIGHSAGETSVLATSGAGSKAMALEVAIARGRAFTIVENDGGTMAAVSCSTEHALSIVEEVHRELGEGVLTIGCYNAQNAVTLSGVETHIDAAVVKASTHGIFARKLRTRVPVHSSLMNHCAEDFKTLMAEVFARHPTTAPAIETYSSTTGEAFTCPFDSAYFWDGTIGPVRFHEAISALISRHSVATFVEIGPHPALSSYLMDYGTASTVICPLRRPRAPDPGIEVREFVGALGKIITSGHNCVNFDILYPKSIQHEKRQRVKAPPYPFVPKVIPWAVQTAEIERQRQKRNGPMNYPQLAMNVKTHPGLADHIIKGEPIMPAAGFIEMVLQYGASEVLDVEFHGILPLSSEKPLPVQIELNGTRWSVSSVASADFNPIWPIRYNRLHATGYLSMEQISDQRCAPLDLNAIRSSMKAMDETSFYDELSSFANYGPMYRRLRKFWLTTNPGGAMDALGEIRGAGNDIPSVSEYRLHPAIFDAAIHLIAHPYITGNLDPELYHLPSKLRALRLCPDFYGRLFPDTVFSYAKFVEWTPNRITYNITITDDAGLPLCVIEGLEVALHGYRLSALERRFSAAYLPTGVSLSLSKSIGSDITHGNTNPEPSQPLNVNEPGTCDLEMLVIPYVRGMEIEIQRRIANLDPLQTVSLTFETEYGPYGDAAQGFTRSLRKEYLSWKIRLISFHNSWTPPQRSKAIADLVRIDPDKLDVQVEEDGTVLSPRLVPMDPPRQIATVDTNKPWKIENDHIVQIPLPSPYAEDIVVSVTRTGPRHGKLWTFVGMSESFDLPVIGISSGPFASHVRANPRGVLEVQPQMFEGVGPAILPSALVALTVGPHEFVTHNMLSGVRILVVENDSTLRSQIEDLCADLGMRVLAVPSLSPAHLETCYNDKPTFILSGTQDPATIAQLRTILGPGGTLFTPNHADGGIESISARQPWRLATALRCAVEHPGHRTAIYAPPSSLLRDYTPALSHTTALFDHEKSYLLVGGLGRLGLHIALWMYEHGARELVLTSRGGMVSLQRRGDHIAERILLYLLSRPDLRLKAVAADGTSPEEMTNVIRSINRPLGGCALLAVLLSDGMFSSLTEEAFERVFPPKIQTFHVLEKIIDIKSLDFFVSFSSVCGLFGNAGQTNYATANMALTGMTQKYRNAFTMVSPVIVDMGDLMMLDKVSRKNLRHLLKWGMTARALCDCMGDGIMKLRGGHPGGWQYVPDFDWAAVKDNMGPSYLYDHLAPQDAADSTETQSADASASVLQVVCRVMALKEEEISTEVPLTTYGLDSLSAAAVSFALRPFLAVSQVQLLADLTIKDLQQRAEHGPTALPL